MLACGENTDGQCGHGEMKSKSGKGGQNYNSCSGADRTVVFPAPNPALYIVYQHEFHEIFDLGFFWIMNRLEILGTNCCFGSEIVFKMAL